MHNYCNLQCRKRQKAKRIPVAHLDIIHTINNVTINNVTVSSVTSSTGIIITKTILITTSFMSPALRVNTCIYVYTLIDIYIYIYTYIWKYIYIYIHTYIHTYILPPGSRGASCHGAAGFGGWAPIAWPGSNTVDFRNFIVFFSGRDPGTLKSDIVSKKHPQLICSDLRLSD